MSLRRFHVKTFKHSSISQGHIQVKRLNHSLWAAWGTLMDSLAESKGNALLSSKEEKGVVFLFPSCPLVAKAQQTTKTLKKDSLLKPSWSCLVILKRVPSPAPGLSSFCPREQPIGSPNYIALPSGICSYHSRTRPH